MSEERPAHLWPATATVLIAIAFSALCLLVIVWSLPNDVWPNTWLTAMSDAREREKLCQPDAPSSSKGWVLLSPKGWKQVITQASPPSYMRRDAVFVRHCVKAFSTLEVKSRFEAELRSDYETVICHAYCDGYLSSGQAREALDRDGPFAFENGWGRSRGDRLESRGGRLESRVDELESRIDALEGQSK